MAPSAVRPPLAQADGAEDRALPQSLLDAYRATRYIVQTEPPLVLRIDQGNAALAALLAAHSLATAAIVSAANPASVRLPEAENAIRHRALEAAVTQQGFAAIATVHVADAGDWPDETGLLVLGASPRAAAELGQRFGQNAIVTITADGVPQLQRLR